LYDENLPGFDPLSWPCCVRASERTRRLLLQVPIERGGGTSVLDMHRAACCSDKQLLRVMEEVINAHGLVREDDGGVGGMVGVEDHLDYNGHVVKFKVPSPEVRCRVQDGLEFAGRVFGEHFEKRGVGYEEMLDKQEELWPLGK
jgi:hypothetical protein